MRKAIITLATVTRTLAMAARKIDPVYPGTAVARLEAERLRLEQEAPARGALVVGESTGAVLALGAALREDALWAQPTEGRPLRLATRALRQTILGELRLQLRVGLCHQSVDLLICWDLLLLLLRY